MIGRILGAVFLLGSALLAFHGAEVGSFKFLGSSIILGLAGNYYLLLSHIIEEHYRP